MRGSRIEVQALDMAERGDSLALLRASIDRAGNFQSWRHGADCSPVWHPVSRDGQRLRSGFPSSLKPEGPPLPFVAKTWPPRSGSQTAAPGRYKGRVYKKKPLPRPSASKAAAAGAYKRPRDPREEDLEAQITDWAATEAPHASASDIAFMLWSLSAVESKNLVLVDAILVRANAQAREFSLTELAVAVRAIAALNVSPSANTMRDVLLRVADDADKFSRNTAEDMLRALHQSGLVSGAEPQDPSLPARRAVAALEHRCSNT